MMLPVEQLMLPPRVKSIQLIDIFKHPVATSNFVTITEVNPDHCIVKVVDRGRMPRIVLTKTGLEAHWDHEDTKRDTFRAMIIEYRSKKDRDDYMEEVSRGFW
jgi:hypothetical protein